MTNQPTNHPTNHVGYGAEGAHDLILDVMAGTMTTRAELARKLEVSTANISQILNRQQELKLGTLARILEAMGWELCLDAVPMTRKEQQA